MREITRRGQGRGSQDSRNLVVFTFYHMSVQTRLALKPRPYTSRCVNEYIAGLKKDVSEGWHRVVSDRAMNHDVGNLLNAIVFGRTYDKGDEAWNAIQRAREDGIKILGVASGLQFLPWLSWLQAKVY